MTQLVSILIPAYNAEQWIRETIQSALDQTWSRKELIIVDDGSRDRTLNAARAFESNSVKVVTQENRGASSARNRALSLAQGDYIQWLDADDLLAPDKITRQMEAAGDGQRSRILLSSAWARFYFRREKAAFQPHSLWADLPPLEWLLIKFRESRWVHPGAWLVSRKLTDSAGPWDERLSFDDDGEYFCRVVGASGHVAFVAGARCFYRSGNAGSLSWGMSKKAADSFFLATSLSIRHLLSLENSERTRSAGLKFLQARLAYFHPERPDLVGKIAALSADLGGSCTAPSESLTFACFRKVLGRERAKKLKALSYRARVATARNWDRVMYLLSGRGGPRNPRIPESGMRHP